MTIIEARKKVEAFEKKANPTDIEIFDFSETMDFIIKEVRSPEDMVHLAEFYYRLKRFDLALKYYEMAATLDYEPAYENLGYLWFYGRAGKKDYAKAFYYFSRLMERGNQIATYKVADMYKNGYYVEKDYFKYVNMIEGLYKDLQDSADLSKPVPEVLTRLAKIRALDGKLDDALGLYLYAKEFLARRIVSNPYFGNLNIMKWLIDDLYSVSQFEADNFDFYDLFYILKSPHKVSFQFNGKEIVIESVREGFDCNIHYDEKWFHSRDDFFMNAMINDQRLVTFFDRFTGYKLIY